MSWGTFEKVIIWIAVTFYIVLFALFVIWRIFGDHHADNGAMQYLRIHAG